VRGKAWNTDAPTLPESEALHDARAAWPERDWVACPASAHFLQPLRCTTKLALWARLQANKLTFKASLNFMTCVTEKRCCFALHNRPCCASVFDGGLATPPISRALVFVLPEMLGDHRRTFVTPNVRAKRATTAGRQTRAGENVPRTTGPGLVACRWRSA
jgi:hypothetical protein